MMSIAHDAYIWAELTNSLLRFQAETQQRTSNGHDFRFVSQGQAVPAANAHVAWSQGDPIAPEPGLGLGALRASLYNHSFSSQQLSAFLYASRASCLDHASVALLCIEQKRGGLPLVMLRGLIERIALAERVEKAVAPVASIRDSGDEFMQFQYGSGAYEVIIKALYGTRLNWAALIGQELRDAKSREFSYKKRKGFADEGAIQILNCIDLLNKRIPGIRLVYDILCEFLHPNVGDLFSATATASSRDDSWGTRHSRRRLETGKRDFHGASDVTNILRECTDIASHMIDCAPQIHESIDRSAKIYIRLNKRMMHRMRKKQKRLFHRDDLCPCLSGLAVAKCK